jgi:hypothetical protein
VKEHQHERAAQKLKLKLSTGMKLQRSRVFFAHRRVPDIRHPSPNRDDFCDMHDEHGDGDSSSSDSDDSSEGEYDEMESEPDEE